MCSTHVFMLGWRPLGSRKRRWLVQDCIDVEHASRIAADLARLDGGSRWRVYGTLTVPADHGSVRVDRGGVLAEGVERPPFSLDD